MKTHPRFPGGWASNSHTQHTAHYPQHPAVYREINTSTHPFSGDFRLNLTNSNWQQKSTLWSFLWVWNPEFLMAALYHQKKKKEANLSPLVQTNARRASQEIRREAITTGSIQFWREKVRQWLAFSEHLLLTTHSSQGFTNINPFNSLHNLTWGGR